MNPSSPVRFIHISDTHIGPSTDAQVNGVAAYERSLWLVRAISKLPFTPDFIVHTGDVVSDPDPRSIRLVKGMFAELPKVPLYVVTGNHDDSSELREAFPMQGATPLISTSRKLSYRFSCKGHTFIGLDAKIEGEITPEGLVGPEQLSALEASIKDASGSVTVFIHYPPFSIDCAWADRNMLLRDGAHFHAILARYSAKITGVFFGHVHRSIHISQDGISYSSIASPLCQFIEWPELQAPDFEREGTGFFSIVTIDGNRQVIKEIYYPPCSVAVP